MQDKRSEINQEYIHSSWLEMKDILDIHLPEKKSRSFIWWLLPIGMIILTLVIYNYPIPNRKNINDSKEILNIPDKNEEKRTKNKIDALALSPNDVNTHNHKNEEIITSKTEIYISNILPETSSDVNDHSVQDKKNFFPTDNLKILKNKTPKIDNFNTSNDRFHIEKPEIFHFPFMGSKSHRPLIVSEYKFKNRSIIPKHRIEDHNSGILLYVDSRLLSPANINGELGLGFKKYIYKNSWLLPGIGIGYDNFIYNSRENVNTLLSGIQPALNATNIQNFKSKYYSSLSLQLGIDYKYIYGAVSIYQRFLNSPLLNFSENDAFAETFSADNAANPGQQNQDMRDIDIIKTTNNPLFLGFSGGYYVNDNFTITIKYHFQINNSEQLSLSSVDNTTGNFNLDGKRTELRIGLQYQF